MSNTLGDYSFLPWLRQGIANQITAADGAAGVQVRASMQVQLRIEGDPLSGAALQQLVSRQVALFGPGDVISMDKRAVVRTEPRHWITNYEPNYLAHIEFYDEDFPWRYTPAAPNTALHRLRPWITLVVLREDEFAEAKNVQGRPLPFIEVEDTNVFPPAAQLWAWAHVHTNRGLSSSAIESEDMNVILPELQSLLDGNADLACSRLLCPRMLEPNTAYHAFVVPTFESGRLAGLGRSPAETPYATFAAWDAYPAGTRMEGTLFPYYYRWYFRTGTVGDFEYLVRLLKPMAANARVGIREMDVQQPGANLPGINDAALGGILRLGGALRVPRASMQLAERAEADRYDNWANTPPNTYPHPFQRAAAALINLTDDYAAQTPAAAHQQTTLPTAVQAHPDPVITMPLYGRWHGLTQRLLNAQDGTDVPHHQNWVHDLNLDPRHRVAAGFGTHVVQKNQEAYMDAAWSQVGDVLEANRKIRAGQLAKAVSSVWHTRHLKPMAAANPVQTLALTAPVQRRVMAGHITVQEAVKHSRLTPASTAPVLRRLLRPRGVITRRALRKTQGITTRVRTPILPPLLLRVNEGRVRAAPIKRVPEGVLTLNKIRNLFDKKLQSDPKLRDQLEKTLKDFGGLDVALRWIADVDAESIPRLPRNADFQLRPLPREGDKDGGKDGGQLEPVRGEKDNEMAMRFKDAIGEAAAMMFLSDKVSPTVNRAPISIATLAGTTLQAINPALTIPRRVLGMLQLPARILDLLQNTEIFEEVMAYPEFDVPMYEPLEAISTDLFVPNLHLIEENSITLLETNQVFIEAYMVGLNHEFARELLWREYPTDQRGSYFRQFWDVSGFLPPAGTSAEALREQLKDIPPLHLWPRASNLGDHDHREGGSAADGAAEEEVVLVIRGELLKKYPNCVVYAHRAAWQLKGDGTLDNQKERRLVELTAAQAADPPRTLVKTPLYEAKAGNDIHFFGFDLTVTDAQGGTGANPTDDPGWFFVLKERPGEPRFGMDIERTGPLNVWNDLAWSDALPGAAPGSYLQINAAMPPLVNPTAPEVSEKAPQYAEDVNITWDANTNAADLAYILYQAPVLVAVHAAEMLPRP